MSKQGFHLDVTSPRDVEQDVEIGATPNPSNPDNAYDFNGNNGNADDNDNRSNANSNDTARCISAAGVGIFSLFVWGLPPVLAPEAQGSVAFFDFIPVIELRLFFEGSCEGLLPQAKALGMNERTQVGVDGCKTRQLFLGSAKRSVTWPVAPVCFTS